MNEGNELADSHWAPSLRVARQAVTAAAAVLQAHRTDWVAAESAVGRDLKLVADRESERIILEALRPTGLPVLSEETGASPDWARNGTFWVVDPLDGSFNFQHGFPLACISVGLVERGQPVAGVIHDLAADRTVWGAVDAGAFEDGRRLAVSTVGQWSQAALTTGFPVAFVDRVQRVKKVRMLGSACASLLSVARGVFDAYYEEDICLWDVAAGLALVQAAGGRVATRPGRSPHQVAAYAGNARLTPITEPDGKENL
jgi:myo-inositol-1(or 4)-monophosphatase